MCESSTSLLMPRASSASTRGWISAASASMSSLAGRTVMPPLAVMRASVGVLAPTRPMRSPCRVTTAEPARRPASAWASALSGATRGANAGSVPKSRLAARCGNKAPGQRAAPLPCGRISEAKKAAPWSRSWLPSAEACRPMRLRIWMSPRPAPLPPISLLSEGSSAA